MDANTLLRSKTPTPARLLIHTEDDVSAGGRHFESTLRRLRESHSGDAKHDKRTPLKLQIHNLQGIPVHSVDEVGPLIDVPLPAGTYHVTVQFGTVRRRYTMTLEPGASFDLYLRRTPDRQ